MPHTFGLDREVIRVGDDLTLGLYSAERSLIDMIRLRHRAGAEIAWEALRRRKFGDADRVSICALDQIAATERVLASRRLQLLART